MPESLLYVVFAHKCAIRVCSIAEVTEVLLSITNLDCKINFLKQRTDKLKSYS